MADKRRSFSSYRDFLDPRDAERRRAHFQRFLDANKLRRRPGEEPPTAALAEPRPKRPSLSGGAAAALTFDETD